MVSPPPPAPEDVPITSSRAVRLAVTRAADLTHGLPLTVMGLREEVAALDDMLKMPDAADMLLGLMRHDQVIGLVALDMQMRAALGEVQTIGRVLAAPSEERTPTETDCVLATPLMSAIIAHLDETTAPTPLAGWAQGAMVARRIADTRAAGLILTEDSYRVIRMTIDLHVDGRQGTVLMALPDHLALPTKPTQQTDNSDWATQFQAVVNAAPVHLDAEIARFKIPLAQAQGLQAGQVIPLVGAQVTSVKLRAADGRRVATARLGQSGGKRAIRIETPPPPDLGGFALPEADLPMMGQGGFDQLPGTVDDAFDPDAKIDMAMDESQSAMGNPPALDAGDGAMIDEIAPLGTGVTLGGHGEDELGWSPDDD